MVLKLTTNTVLITTVLLSIFLSQRLTHERFVSVDEGALRHIVTQLKSSGVDLGEADIRLISLFGLAKSGTIDFERANSTRLDFYASLLRGKSAFDEIRLLPGETTAVALREIAEKLGLDANKLYALYLHYAPYPEGVLIPETYQIIKNTKEEALIELLVTRALKVHRSRAIEAFGEYNEKKWFVVVTKASIVQKEAANAKEMPLVASVIENRLAKRMRLQMDGTLNYGEFSHQRVTPERIRTDFSPFNTYKYSGLPPFPVALPSSEAIAAAVNPIKSDYLYFVRGADGKHNFTDSYNEHLNNIGQVKKP